MLGTIDSDDDLVRADPTAGNAQPAGGTAAALHAVAASRMGDCQEDLARAAVRQHQRAGAVLIPGRVT